MALIIKRRPEAGQRFPFIALPRAIERARELYRVANGHDVPFSAATKAWGYAEKSSGGAQTASALKTFGLMDDVGGGDIRKVKLTDAAMKILRDPREFSPDRDALLKEAAIRPPIHKAILDKYGGLPPSDEALKAHLLLDLGMKDEAVSDFMREFAATMAFAKVSESPIIQDMFEVNESDQEDAAEPKAHTASVNIGVSHAMRPQASSGQRQEVFGLDEGDVTLTFPANLSEQSYEDLAAYLALFLRKAKRRAKADSSGSPSEDPSP